MIVSIAGKVMCCLKRVQPDGKERKVLQVAQIDPVNGYSVVNVSVEDFNGYKEGAEVNVRAKVGLFVSDRGKTFLTIKAA